MTMEDRGDNPVAPGAQPAVPVALAAVPAGSMVRVSIQTGGRRVLLGIGTFGSIEPGILETGVRAVASPDAPYLAMIRDRLVAGPLGREAGVATWIRLPVVHRLLHGFDEEQHTVERLVGRPYNVDFGALLDQLATGALRCQVAGHPKTIKDAHCTILCRAANVLEALRETLAVVWDGRVRLEVERGSDPAQAVELLNLDALHGAVGVEFDPFVFGPATDPLQESVLVLLRAAAAVRGALPQSPDDVRERAPLVEDLDQAARILCDCRPSVEGSGGTATGFLDEIRATEQLLRAVRPWKRERGRPRLTVEREVATALVAFLVRETERKLLGYAAALLGVACPRLAEWREVALEAVCGPYLHDARFDAARRKMLARRRPHELSPAERTRYRDLLSKRLDRFLEGAV
jgi:hypothetical protein